MISSAKTKLFVLPLLLCAVAAAHSQTDAQQPIRIGIGGLETLERLEAKYEPLADYLSREIGHPVEMFYLWSSQDLIQAMVQQRIQVMYGFAGAYTEARRHGAAEPLVKRVRTSGNSRYHGVIFTRANSGIKSLQDLRGKSIAFSDRYSDGGYVLPRLTLARAGIIDLNRFFKSVTFKYNRDGVMYAVLTGQADVGVIASHLYDQFWRNPQELQKVMPILARTDDIELGPVSYDPQQIPLNSGIVARMRQAFLQIRLDSPDPSIRKLAKGLSIQEFTVAKDSDYDAIRAAWDGVRQLPEVFASPEREDAPEFDTLMLDPVKHANIPTWHPANWVSSVLLSVIGLSVIVTTIILPARQQRTRLQARFTTYFVAFVAVVLTIFAITTMVQQRRIILREAVESRLRLVERLAKQSQDLLLKQNRAGIEEFVATYLKQYAEEVHDQFPHANIRIAFVEGSGRMIYPERDPFRNGEPFVAEYWTLRSKDPKDNLRIGGVQISLPVEQMDATWFAAMRQWFIVLLCAVLVAYGLSSSLAAHLVQPIAQLTGAAERIGKEATSHLTWNPLPEKVSDLPPKDEVGRLVDTFNQMALHLEYHDRELRHKVEELEQTQKELEMARKRDWMAFTAGLAHNFRRETSGYLRYCDELIEFLRTASVSEPDSERLLRAVRFIRETAYDRGTFFDFLHYFAMRQMGRDEPHTVDPLRLTSAADVCHFAVNLFERGKQVNLARGGRGQGSKWAFDEIQPLVVVPSRWTPGTLAERPVMVFIWLELLNNAVKWCSGALPIEIYACQTEREVVFGLTNDLQLRVSSRDDLDSWIPRCPHDAPRYYQWTQDVAERYLCDECLASVISEHLLHAPAAGETRRSDEPEYPGTGLGLFLIDFFVTEFYRGVLRLGVCDHEFYQRQRQRGLSFNGRNWQKEKRVFCEFTVAYGAAGYVRDEG